MARHLPHRRQGTPRRRAARDLRHRQPGHHPGHGDRHPVRFAAAHVIGDQAAKADLRIDFTFTGLGETWTARIMRAVLNARRGASTDTQPTVSGPKAALVGVLLQPASAGQLAQAGKSSSTATSLR